MNENVKLGITIGAFAAVVLGLMLQLYRQMSYVGDDPFKNPTSVKAQIDTTQRAIEDAEAKIAQLPDKRVELKKWQQEEKKAVQLLPSESTPDDLLRAIRKKAEEAGVKPRYIKPSRSDSGRPGFGAPGMPGPGGGGGGGAKQEEWLFRIDLIGTYDQIAVFINKMEEFEIAAPSGQMEKRFFAVRELEISAPGNGVTEDGINRCKLTMQTFRYIAPAQM